MEIIELKLGEQRTVVLKGRGSAGYGWFATIAVAAVASVTESGTIPPAGAVPGCSGSNDEVFTITGLSPGKTLVYFALERPWQRGKPIATREFSVIVR